jgi:hypothetical protein
VNKHADIIETLSQLGYIALANAVRDALVEQGLLDPEDATTDGWAAHGLSEPDEFGGVIHHDADAFFRDLGETQHVGKRWLLADVPAIAQALGTPLAGPAVVTIGQNTFLASIQNPRGVVGGTPHAYEYNASPTEFGSKYFRGKPLPNHIAAGRLITSRELVHYLAVAREYMETQGSTAAT